MQTQRIFESLSYIKTKDEVSVELNWYKAPYPLPVVVFATSKLFFCCTLSLHHENTPI